MNCLRSAEICILCLYLLLIIKSYFHAFVSIQILWWFWIFIIYNDFFVILLLLLQAGDTEVNQIPENVHAFNCAVEYQKH